MKKTVLITLIGFFIFSNCIGQEQERDTISVRTSNPIIPAKLPLVEDGNIKNVIFIIGDGTGLAQLASSQLSLVGAEGLLHIQTMPVTGLVKTYSADNLITDSASSATAYSCGVKTDNGMIGQLPDGRHCKTILEMAEEKGLSTGIVATSTITHATPASYASHVVSRGMQAEIAEQYLESEAEIILGGGLEYFIPSTMSESSREDDLDLTKKFKEKGYDFVQNLNELNASKSGQILGLFSPSGMPSENRTPTLAEMTSKAIDVLSTNEEGFFLMIEGSQIDWAGHGNDADYLLREVKDFDAAVKQVLDFAKENGETLVVLTADHETGGMTLQGANSETNELEIVWTSGGHTGIPVPLMAYGPHAIEFTGWWDNIEVGVKVAELLNVGSLPFIEE